MILVDVLCSNFVKFGRLEIERCLPDKTFLPGSPAVTTAQITHMGRAQNLPGPAPDNVPRVLQISSKFVHFWQNYSRMCEH